MSLTELKPGNESYDWIYKWMQDSNVTPTEGLIFNKYENVKVYKVDNPQLMSLYEQRKGVISKEPSGKGDVIEKKLFHGTEDAMTIIKNGFYLKDEASGMIGKGVYFAEHSSKSNQYTKGWNKACQEHQKQKCPMCVRQILVCDVILGKALCDLEKLKDIIQPPKVGLHSDEVKPLGTLKYPEYIVYKADQAYPAYLVEYQIKHVQKAVNVGQNE